MSEELTTRSKRYYANLRKQSLLFIPVGLVSIIAAHCCLGKLKFHTRTYSAEHAKIIAEQGTIYVEVGAEKQTYCSDNFVVKKDLVAGAPPHVELFDALPSLPIRLEPFLNYHVSKETQVTSFLAQYTEKPGLLELLAGHKKE